MKIKDALIDDTIDYREFNSMLQEADIGDWDSINSTEVIEMYIAEMMPQGIHVSHILKALEQEESEYEDWHIWLGNSSETPTPINSKQDLLTALGVWEEEELEQEIEVECEDDFDYDDGSIPSCDCGCN